MKSAALGRDKVNWKSAADIHSQGHDFGWIRWRGRFLRSFLLCGCTESTEGYHASMWSCAGERLFAIEELTALQKLPIIGEYWVKEVPPSDNVRVIFIKLLQRICSMEQLL